MRGLELDPVGHRNGLVVTREQHVVHRLDHLRLATDRVVDRLGTHPGSSGQPAHRRGVVALSQQHLASRLEDAAPRQPSRLDP